MDRQLNEIGAIPVTTPIIESLYPELKSADKKGVQKFSLEGNDCTLIVLIRL